jgi:hypothetical protein
MTSRLDYLARKGNRQWKAVLRERERLSAHAVLPKTFAELSPEFSFAHHRLEKAWSALESSLYRPIIHRGKRLSKRDGLGYDEYPLVGLMEGVRCGGYPQPELLLGLLDSWQEYLRAAGKKSLEEVFLGKPKPKAGNYARRAASKKSREWLLSKMAQLVRQGSSQADAAAMLVREHNLPFDADSLARTFRAELKLHRDVYMIIQGAHPARKKLPRSAK